MSEQRSPDALQRARAAWQRWEMDTFDPPPAPPPQPPPPDVPLPTAAQVRAELDRAMQLARESGRAQGYAEGHAQGLAQGSREGHEAGHALGKQQGFQAGLLDGKAQAEQQAAQLQTLAGECARSLSDLEQEIGQSLISLASTIAEQVLHSTLDAHPEKMLDIVREVVRMHGDSDAVLTLHVHPDDHDMVQRHLQHDGAIRRWRLQADPSIQPGGCRADTALGAIDATLQTRWRRVLGTLGLSAPPAARHSA